MSFSKRCQNPIVRVGFSSHGFGLTGCLCDYYHLFEQKIIREVLDEKATFSKMKDISSSSFLIEE